MLRTSLADTAPLVEAAISDWAANDKVARLWSGDSSLWTGGDEDHWLGWLGMPAGGGALDQALVAKLREHIEHESIGHVAVLGMGGSSLAPDVLAHTFGAETAARGGPQLHVFDSTVPAQVRHVVAGLNLESTLFLVASKSGSTIEPNVLFAHLWDGVERKIGSERAGSRFAAITDPGSALEQVARDKGFVGIAYGIPEIGGRFSALSPFGLLPGALMGLDTPDFLERARAMAEACGRDVAPSENPGVHLGLVMGALAKSGRDKLTFVISPGIESLGAWLEQLIAESTGKRGRGIVPIGDEPIAAPEAYGADRLFAYVRLAHAPSVEQDAAIDALEQAGHPVVRVELADTHELGAEFFRWEVATAVAGSLLELNPFLQPDVESAKVAARSLMTSYEEQGALPSMEPVLEADGMTLFADPAAVAAGVSLSTTLSTPLSAGQARAALREALAAHLARLEPGDYFALNAYLASSEENDEDLQAIRTAVRDRHHVATTLGYGPRFLHSTGQLHKGGPNTGVYLQLTAEDPDSLPIPGLSYSMGVLARAQAQGDFAVLVERGRRAFWLHLSDPRAGLARLRDWLT